MRIAIGVGSAYYDGSNWEDIVELVRHADRIGVDVAWSAEAWGMETIAPLAYLAAVTERIQLGTGIMQITARAPSMTAMTALSMARLTDDRFCLGLGVSGPQVVEGLHGASFAKPLSRLREYVEIVQLGLRGERLEFDGDHYQLPRPGGEGKALRLSMPAKPDLPLYLATLGPKSLEFTGEVADGWLGTSFIPEAAETSLRHLRIGAERSGRTLADLDLQVGGAFDIDDDVDAVIERHRPRLAFSLGAMGSADTNFYNDAYSRAGWADAASEVQSLWVSGRRDAAIAAVPDEFVLAANLIGDETMVRRRVEAHAGAGITTMRIGVSGSTLDQQIDHLERAVDLIRSTGS
jgi:F420-dependent oxidoreductase-like protein